MNMSALASGSFDAAYQIEATCHAPDIRGVYAEIFRVLKPGGAFASYEWCLTDAYDESNAEHRQCKHDILLGNGLPDLRPTTECLQALKDVGFVVETEFDLAAQSDVAWYEPIDASTLFSVRNFRLSRFGRAVTHYAVWALEALRIAPPGTVDVSSFLVKGADALVAGGRKEVRYHFACKILRDASPPALLMLTLRCTTDFHADVLHAGAQACCDGERERREPWHCRHWADRPVCCCGGCGGCCCCGGRRALAAAPQRAPLRWRARAGWAGKQGGWVHTAWRAPNTGRGQPRRGPPVVLAVIKTYILATKTQRRDRAACMRVHRRYLSSSGTAPYQRAAPAPRCAHGGQLARARAMRRGVAAAALAAVHALFALFLALAAAAAALRRALPAPSECVRELCARDAADPVCADAAALRAPDSCLLCRAGAAALCLAPLPAPLRRRLLGHSAGICVGAAPGVVGFSFGAACGAAAHPNDVAALALAAVAAGARTVLLYDAAGAPRPRQTAALQRCKRMFVLCLRAVASLLTRPGRAAPAGELERGAEALAAALAAAAPAAAPAARLLLGHGRGAAKRCIALPGPTHAPLAALWLLSPSDAAEPMLVRPSRGLSLLVLLSAL